MNIGIAIFCFERLDKLEQMIKSLNECSEVDNFDVWIFHDGPSIENSKEHYKVASFLKGKFPFFKSLNVISRKKNLGLKKNITEGIMEVFETCDAIIVLEDDLILHKDFLIYMRNSLHLYSDNPSISIINGWLPSKYMKKNVFYTNKFNCWGWATWKHSWSYKNYCKNITTFFDFYELQKYCHGFSGNLWSQIYMNNVGKKDTWAINTQLAIWKEKKLCLNPPFSLVLNDGEDGEGSNSWASGETKTLAKIRINIDDMCNTSANKFDTVPYKKNNLKSYIFNLAFNYKSLFIISRLIYSQTSVYLFKYFHSLLVKK